MLVRRCNDRDIEQSRRLCLVVERIHSCLRAALGSNITKRWRSDTPRAVIGEESTHRAEDDVVEVQASKVRLSATQCISISAW
jgi:hypothetical protein